MHQQIGAGGQRESGQTAIEAGQPDRAGGRAIVHHQIATRRDDQIAAGGDRAGDHQRTIRAQDDAGAARGNPHCTCHEPRSIHGTVRRAEIDRARGGRIGEGEVAPAMEREVAIGRADMRGRERADRGERYAAAVDLAARTDGEVGGHRDGIGRQQDRGALRSEGAAADRIALTAASCGQLDGAAAQAGEAEIAGRDRLEQATRACAADGDAAAGQIDVARRAAGGQSERTGVADRDAPRSGDRARNGERAGRGESDAAAHGVQRSGYGDVRTDAECAAGHQGGAVGGGDAGAGQRSAGSGEGECAAGYIREAQIGRRNRLDRAAGLDRSGRDRTLRARQIDRAGHGQIAEREAACRMEQQVGAREEPGRGEAAAGAGEPDRPARRSVRDGQIAAGGDDKVAGGGGRAGQIERADAGEGDARSGGDERPADL